MTKSRRTVAMDKSSSSMSNVMKLLRVPELLYLRNSRFLQRERCFGRHGSGKDVVSVTWHWRIVTSCLKEFTDHTLHLNYQHGQFVRMNGLVLCWLRHLELRGVWVKLVSRACLENKVKSNARICYLLNITQQRGLSEYNIGMLGAQFESKTSLHKFSNI